MVTYFPALQQSKALSLIVYARLGALERGQFSQNRRGHKDYRTVVAVSKWLQSKVDGPDLKWSDWEERILRHQLLRR